MEFPAIVPLKNGKADTITVALLKFLEDVGLPINKMCVLGSDGAKVMVGKHNGVAAQLKQSAASGE